MIPEDVDLCNVQAQLADKIEQLTELVSEGPFSIERGSCLKDPSHKVCQRRLDKAQRKLDQTKNLLTQVQDEESNLFNADASSFEVPTPQLQMPIRRHTEQGIAIARFRLDK